MTDAIDRILRALAILSDEQLELLAGRCDALLASVADTDPAPPLDVPDDRDTERGTLHVVTRSHPPPGPHDDRWPPCGAMRLAA